MISLCIRLYVSPSSLWFLGGGPWPVRVTLYSNQQRPLPVVFPVGKHTGFQTRFLCDIAHRRPTEENYNVHDCSSYQAGLPRVRTR